MSEVCVYIDRVIPMYIFMVIQYAITIGTFTTLKNIFERVVQAEEALLASQVEEDVWLFRGKIRTLFQDPVPETDGHWDLGTLGFNQHNYQSFQDVIRNNNFIPQVSELIGEIGESTSSLLMNRWRDYIIEIFPSQITNAVNRAMSFTTTLINQINQRLTDTFKRFIMNLKVKQVR